MNLMLAMLLVVLSGWWLHQYRQARRFQAQMRQQLFDECVDLLQEPSIRRDLAQLPILEGCYGGYHVALSVVEDTVGWRKLPPLWLLVKVAANAPTRGTLDIIARPANNEFYSPSWQWDGVLPIPAAWPQHALIKYQEQAVDLVLLNDAVPLFFADPAMKELLITPTLLRLTYLLRQGQAGEYLLLRTAAYHSAPVAKALVEALLLQAIALRQQLEAATH